MCLQRRQYQSPLVLDGYGTPRLVPLALVSAAISARPVAKFSFSACEIVE